MANIPVKYFTSSMQGAPQLTDAVGSMTEMLDACLVNGFNIRSVSTLTYAAGVATAHINAGHLFKVDQVVKVSGADQTAYNGEFRIVSATASDFTYAVVGTPASPATGTVSVKVAPLNFEKAFTATNKRAYRSTNVLSNRPYLRVDDSLDPAWTTTYAKKAKVLMAENMSDIDTVVGAQAPFDPVNPTKNTIGSGSGSAAVDGWYKWYYARQTNSSTDSNTPEAFNRDWVLVGDDRGFYLFNETGTASKARGGYCFTDFTSFRQGDAYSTLLMATESYIGANTLMAGGGLPDASNNCNRSLDFTGKVLMRDHLQVGGTVRAGFLALNTNNAQQISGFTTSVPWPNGPDYGLLLHPIYLRQEAPGHVRGKLPGIFWVHNDSPLNDLDVVSGVAAYAGRKFLMVASGFGSLGPVAKFAFDITGPWA